MSRSAGRSVILICHGSKLKGFDEPMRRLARDLERSREYDLVLCAYLEINTPSIPEAIDACFEKGMKEVVLLPYFLLKGRHTKEDIPRFVAAAKNKYSGKMKVRLRPYLGYDGKILALVEERLKGNK